MAVIEHDAAGNGHNASGKRIAETISVPQLFRMFPTDTWTLSDVDAEWINLLEAKRPGLYRVLLAAQTDSDKSYLAHMAVRLLEPKARAQANGQHPPPS